MAAALGAAKDNGEQEQWGTMGHGHEGRERVEEGGGGGSVVPVASRAANGHGPPSPSEFYACTSCCNFITGSWNSHKVSSFITEAAILLKEASPSQRGFLME